MNARFAISPNNFDQGVFLGNFNARTFWLRKAILDNELLFLRSLHVLEYRNQRIFNFPDIFSFSPLNHPNKFQENIFLVQVNKL